MAEKNVEVNALGDACPIPVVKTIKAIKSLEGAGTVVTSVDNETAVQNLTKLANDKGYGTSFKKLDDGNFEVTTTVAGTEEAVNESDANDFCNLPAKKNLVVVISADHMGEGDNKLGGNLLKGFIYALSQQEQLPQTILFYNGGAKMTIEGSPALEDLKLMVDAGVEILTCGTCLDFYGIKDKLAVGEVTNMYVICQRQVEATLVVKPC